MSQPPDVLIGPEGFEPPTNQLCIPLRLSPPLSGSWAGLSLHPRGMSAIESLHLPLSKKVKKEAWLGITMLSPSAGFPEFDKFAPVSCLAGGPAGAAHI